MREARFDDAVGHRIQDWSSEVFDGEITAALEEYVGPERVMDDADIQIFATWFHNDRELTGGRTPTERYAARPEIPGDERDAAERIASARLGLYRVLAVAPGRSLTLEELDGSGRIEARSPHVSHEAIRWDILLAHVMDGNPPSLWGPTRFFEPCEEPELRAELARLAGVPSGERALALMRYIPPSRSIEPSFFTLEGDPVVFASAAWTVHDQAAAVERMCELGGLLAGDPLELDITAERAVLVSRRPPLPPGALVLESSPVGAIDTISIATLRLEGDELHAEAMSEQRLDADTRDRRDRFRRARRAPSMRRHAGRRHSPRTPPETPRAALRTSPGGGSPARRRGRARADAEMAGRAAPVAGWAHTARRRLRLATG